MSILFFENTNDTKKQNNENNEIEKSRVPCGLAQAELLTSWLFIPLTIKQYLNNFLEK
jgi:hypothetical protein